MALQIPRPGLQLEEDFTDSFDHLPTQAFILDLTDDVIDGMIASVEHGHEIRLSLGNKPTFLYGSSSHHIEPTFEDETDDIELFLADHAESPRKAERLPQMAMSLFRKPELGNPWAQYRTSSSEDEDEEYDEVASSPEPDDAEQRTDDALDEDIASLRNSFAQKEAEKIEKSARVIEGNAPAPNTKATKRTAGSLKALSGRRSPFGRASLSPLPTSPALSAVGSPSLAPTDITAQQTLDKTKQAQSPIIHELAFKEQRYDILWQKYPGSSEAEFKGALDKVAYLDEQTHNYVLRKKYWKELDVWRHDYASGEERQQAIDNAIRQYDKMRLSTAEPEWERLLRKEERGQGKILSKVQVTIAKGAAASKIRAQRADEPGAESAGGANDSGNRTDEEGADSEIIVSPSRQGANAAGAAASASASAAGKKKPVARETLEKRLLSTKKKNTPSSTTTTSSVKVSPSKAAAARAANEKQNKFKSKEFITDSDTSDSESELAPLSTTVQPSRLASSSSAKPSILNAAKAAVTKGGPAPPADREQSTRDESRSSSAAAAPARKPKPSPTKEAVKPQITAKPPPQKRARDCDDDDSSGSSGSVTPLIKRVKPLSAAPKSSSLKDVAARERPNQTNQRSQPAPLRASNVTPNGDGGSSSSGSSNSNSGGGSSNSSGNSKSKNKTSPVKSSPLAASPPTNASELDLSSEESVPPIGSSNTAKKRKMIDDRRNTLMAKDGISSSGKVKKRRYVSDDLVEKARRFKRIYERYEELYKDMASRDNPPKDRVDELLQMHNRLQHLKTEINEQAMGRA